MKELTNTQMRAKLALAALKLKQAKAEYESVKKEFEDYSSKQK